MRAGFLGQNICSLGFGIATLQAPRLVMDEPVRESSTPPPVNEALPEESNLTGGRKGEWADEKDTLSTGPVANPQRLCV